MEALFFKLLEPQNFPVLGVVLLLVFFLGKNTQKMRTVERMIDKALHRFEERLKSLENRVWGCLVTERKQKVLKKKEEFEND